MSQQEAAVLEGIMQKKQMKDFMQLYSGLVERCFMDCATDFTSGKLKSSEETCVNHCADKFLSLSSRLGSRFSEYNAEQMAKQQ